jgi:hypothetical protein
MTEITDAVEKLSNQELNEAIENEIFGKIPLTEAEWEVAQAVWFMDRCQNFSRRPFKLPQALPNPQTGLMFDLGWPQDYADDMRWASPALVAKMRQGGWLYDLCDYHTENGKTIAAGFTKATVRGEAWAETDALAIARAALIAIRTEKAEKWKQLKAEQNQ